MSGMAEIIAAHQHQFDAIGRVCSCGVLCGVACDNLTYQKHLADELAKAGYVRRDEA